MSEEHIDDRLRGLGMAALHEHEVSVSDIETDAALSAVRARLAGDGGLVSSSARPDDRPLWGLLAAAAAVVALIAGGLVVALGGSDDDTIVPASETPQTDSTSPMVSKPWAKSSEGKS